METDVPVNTGENGNSTWLPDIMSSISTQQEETTFWDEVGTDWRTGVYILAGIRKFLKNYRKFVNRYRRKGPKVDASIFDSALSHTCRSDVSKKKRRK